MKLITLLLLFTIGTAYAQELTRPQLDSLYNLYVKLKTPPAETDIPLSEAKVSKCGFSTVNLVRLNYEKFTPEQKLVLEKVLQRPVTQREILSPRGWFRVHYDVTGTHSLGYDLNLLLQALDSSYNYEVHTLGYPPPRSSTTNETQPYDVYVQNIVDYGYTEFEFRIGNTQTYTSFMVIDNDFNHTQTKGINGARVTVAHELHHGIQVGNYAFKENDIFYHELSSTAMEEFVFNTINDYYYYLDDYFNYPDLSFPSHSGYDLAIWNIFLKEVFNYGLLKRQWELIPDNRALDAVALSLGERNSSFQDAFNKFGVWVYFTGHRAITGKYFEEGARYPVIDNIMERSFSSPQDSVFLNAEPVTHNFITFSVREQGRRDTVTILISNSNYRKANTDPTVAEQVLYELSVDSTLGLTKITEGYYQSFISANPAFWTTSEFINNQLVREGFIRIEANSPYPNPFRYSRHSVISIPIITGGNNEVDFSVFSPSMDLVYNSRSRIESRFGKEIIAWNGRDTGNRRLGSGIYIYVIKSGDDIIKGKIVIFND
jgi:hypothetical protein